MALKTSYISGKTLNKITIMNTHTKGLGGRYTHSSLLLKTFQVVLHIIKATRPGNVDEDARSALTTPVATDGTVADLGRAGTSTSGKGEQREEDL